MQQDYESIRLQSIKWIRQAGMLARERLGTATVSHKEDKSPVTDVDFAVQEMLLDAIARTHPNDAVVTEETQAAPGKHPPISSANRCWVIDPIDGTRNYSRGAPFFAVSVAMLEAGSPVMGVIFDPSADRMYSASTGGGAWLNDQRILAANQPISRETIIGVPSSRRTKLPAIVHHWLDRMVLRNLGSTSMHLALIASGAMDAAFCHECQLWDIAAGAVILKEAGADIVSLEGKAYFPMDLPEYANQQTPFMAGGPAILAQLLDEYHQRGS